MNSSLPFLYIKQKKLQKDLGSKKINTTFASLFQKKEPWAFSSAGLEHLPYKQRVGGSNPSTPTRQPLFSMRETTPQGIYIALSKKKSFSGV